MNQLVELKLSGMVAELSIQVEQPGTYEALSFIEKLALLVSREHLCREQRKQSRLLHKARLRLEASVHDIDYQPSRNLERALIAQLSQNEWVVRGQNLLITGPCGCGKTYMGCALEHNAGQQGYNVQDWRLSRLLSELMQGRADGSYKKQLFRSDISMVLGVSGGMVAAVHYGWQAPFVVIASVAAIGAVLLWFVLPATFGPAAAVTGRTSVFRFALNNPALIRPYCFTVLAFGGGFVFFSYAEPWLTDAAGLEPQTAVLIMGAVGLGSLVVNIVGAYSL